MLTLAQVESAGNVEQDGPVRDWWRRGIARETARLRQDGRAAVLWSMRITIAAVASYVVGTLIFPGTQPLLAPLTAMLVVQVTPVSLLASGLDRVVAVVAGVTLAVGFASVVPLEWWSLGLLILVSITIGQALRLRSNLIEVAISAMLVLGVGALGAGAAASQRIAETLVGAAVGIAANLLFPPRVASSDAGQAIDGLADSVSELLTRAADELAGLVERGGDLRPAARAWLGDARQITHDIPRIGEVLTRAEQGRRFNVRAVGTPNVGPGLRQGLEALEHSAVAIRAMFRAVTDAVHDPAWSEDEQATDDVALGLAQAFREMAAVVDAFGQLVRDEAEPVHPRSADVQGLREALEGLQEARARFEQLLTADPRPELLELHAAVLSTAKRLLQETDLGERLRRQLRLGGAARRRLPPVRPAPPEEWVWGDSGPDAETLPIQGLLPTDPDDGRDERG